MASLAGYTLFPGLSNDVIAATTAVAAGAMLAMLVEMITPDAFSKAHDFAGFVTVAGFVTAFVFTKLEA